jgi:hypothetical protein
LPGEGLGADCVSLWFVVEDSIGEARREGKSVRLI